MIGKALLEDVFLGNNLISWFSKKQNYVSLFIIEAEYTAVGNACTQLIWMKNMLHEYGFLQDIMTLYCDNMSAIDIPKIQFSIVEPNILI